MVYDAIAEAHEKLKEISEFMKESNDLKRVHRLASSNGRLPYDRMILHEKHLFPDVRTRTEVAKYLYSRNTIMKLWYSKIHVELTLGKVLSHLSRLRHDVILVSRVHSYLIRYGYINFGIYRFRIEPKLRCEKKVIIVGAGLAGLSAAQQLLKFGIDVVILEANTRIGGRIYTASHQRAGGGRDFADLGAATIRSIKANPLGTLLGQLNCTPFLISNKIPLYNSKGTIQSSVRNTLMKHLFNHVIKLIGQANSEEAMIDGDGKELDLERSVFNMIQALEIENQYTRNKYWHTFGDKLTEILQANDDKNTELALSKCPPSTSSVQSISQKAIGLTQAELEARRYVDELNSKDYNRREKEEAGANDSRKKTDYCRRDAPAEQYTIEQDMKMLNYHKAVYEGNHGAPLSFLSSKFSHLHEQYRRDNNNIEVKEGLGFLMKKLASAIEDKIELGIKVTEIDYSQDGAVNVKFKKKGSDEVFFVSQGDCVLVTVPLGVLKDVAENKKDCIKFIPSLPQEKLDAIKDMGWGHVNKVSLWFDEQFWCSTAHCFGYLNEEPAERGNMYFFTSAPGSLVLTAMLSGKSAEFEKADEDLMKDCLLVLQNIFGQKKVPVPLKCVVSRWHQDPNIKGAMSYLRPGTNPRVCDILARTVYTVSKSDSKLRSKVYFGGEHTSRDFFGTLEGAWYSGVREAAKVAAGILGSPYQHLHEFKDPFKLVSETNLLSENRLNTVESGLSTPSQNAQEVGICEPSSDVRIETVNFNQPLNIITETEITSNIDLSNAETQEKTLRRIPPLKLKMEAGKKGSEALYAVVSPIETKEDGLLTIFKQGQQVQDSPPPHATMMGAKRKKLDTHQDNNKLDGSFDISPTNNKEKSKNSMKSPAVHVAKNVERNNNELTVSPLKIRINKRSLTKELVSRLPTKSSEEKKTDTLSKSTNVSAKFPNVSSDGSVEFATPEIPKHIHKGTGSSDRDEGKRKTFEEKNDKSLIDSDAVSIAKTPTTRSKNAKGDLEGTDSNLDQDGNCIWAGRKILKPRRCAQESAERTKVMQRAKKQTRKTAANKTAKKIPEEMPYIEQTIYGISPIGNRKIPLQKKDEENNEKWKNPGRANYFPAWFTEGSKFLFKNPVEPYREEPEREFDVAVEDPCFVSLKRGKLKFTTNQQQGGQMQQDRRNLCQECRNACSGTLSTIPEKQNQAVKQKIVEKKVVKTNKNQPKKKKPYKKNIRRTSFTTCRVISEELPQKKIRISSPVMLGSPICLTEQTSQVTEFKSNVDISASQKIASTYSEISNSILQNENVIFSMNAVQNRYESDFNVNNTSSLDVTAYEEIPTSTDNKMSFRQKECSEDNELDGCTKKSLVQLHESEDYSSALAHILAQNVDENETILSYQHELAHQESGLNTIIQREDLGRVFSSDILLDVSAYEEVETTDPDRVSPSHVVFDDDELFLPTYDAYNINDNENVMQNSSVSPNTRPADSPLNASTKGAQNDDNEQTVVSTSNSLNLIISAYGEADLENSSDSLLSSPDESILDEQI